MKKAVRENSRVVKLSSEQHIWFKYAYNKLKDIDKALEVIEDIKSKEDYLMYQRAIKNRKLLVEDTSYNVITGIRAVVRLMYDNYEVGETHSLRKMTNYLNEIRYATASDCSRYYLEQYNRDLTLKELKGYFKFKIGGSYSNTTITILDKNPSCLPPYTELNEVTIIQRKRPESYFI